MTKESGGNKGRHGTIRVGISGWKYGPWRGTFYPKGLVQKRELEFASRTLPCIEINNTFYQLQQPKAFDNWYEQTPPGFMFSIKASKIITHQRRLRDVDTSIANFFASGLFNLKEKLGPILWQFPPTFHFDPTLFESFLAGLPHDTAAAAEIAKKNTRTYGSSSVTIDEQRPMRHAVEIRNQSFVDPLFIELLRRYNVALVVADTAHRWPEFEDVCADFMYLRLHGATELYISGYTEEAIDNWARRIEAWARGSQQKDAKLISDKAAPRRTQRDVFCYFDNTDKIKAPYNATRLLEKLGIQYANDFALVA